MGEGSEISKMLLHCCGHRVYREMLSPFLVFWEMVSCFLGLVEKVVNLPGFSGEVVNFPEIFSELDFSNIIYVYEIRLYASKVMSLPLVNSVWPCTLCAGTIYICKHVPLNLICNSQTRTIRIVCRWQIECDVLVKFFCEELFHLCELVHSSFPLTACSVKQSWPTGGTLL